MAQLTVAKTILEQLGGNRFIAMTGACNLSGTETSLNFKIGRNPKNVTHIRVLLNGLDLYNVTFYRVRGTNIHVLHELENVYAEDLQGLFTEITGLNTHL